MGQGLRNVWDAAVVLEALGAGEAALFSWDADADILRLIGPATALGLGAAAPQCRSAAARALATPADRAQLDRLLTPAEPGARVAARTGLVGGQTLIWRGLWLEEGRRAAGVVAAEAHLAAPPKDPLTGLPPRAAFLASVNARLSEPGEYELAIADLDRLKRINEALGPERGDLVLAGLGSRLAASFAAEAQLGRIGDDGFAVFRAVTDVDGARALREALERPMRVAGYDLLPTFAIGAARATGGVAGPSAAELVRRAELAVESAKTEGLGSSAAYGAGLESHGLSRLELEADLRGAIGRGEILAFFQPIVRLASGELAGFEALARWRHPRKGLLAPDDFLGAMAEMGLMAQLGAHMMRLAAHQLARWRRDHPRAAGITVAVNLSTGEIDRPDLVAEVGGLIGDCGLPPGALKLEVTESDIMRDPERAAKILAELRAAGAALALDDFGTGFSSLSYLTRLPFDTLKIDRYFVRTMGANPGSAKIVRSVVHLGADLGLEVVAEGVENAVMAGQLLKLGCHYGQGFGYAPALPPKDAEVYLNESYLDGAAPVKARG
ncbi:MAG TPA: bifunctional diguanylate cyclase/phosphodiesterase [Caulobacteraceae bacterium]|nr:bifunctional diguanylate cyclase/phosphodiesterase [Caulobacteraceae bacterium]